LIDLTNAVKNSLEYLDKLLEIEPNDTDVLGLKAAVLVESGNLEESIPLYDKAIGINPNNSILFSAKANALVNLGRLNEAKELCEKSLKLDPSNEDAKKLQKIIQKNL